MTRTTRLRRARIRSRPWLAAVLVVWLALAGLFAGAAAWGQEPSSAFIKLDGVDLFKVWSSNDFSAEQRVEGINRRLQEVVDAAEPVRITVEERNNLPVIAIEGQSLLTVTRRDTPEGRSREDRAEEWRRIIENGLQRGRRERQPDHVRRMLAASIASVLAAFALQWLLQLGWNRLSRRFIPSHASPGQLEPRTRGLRFLLRGILALLQVGIWLTTAYLIADRFPLTRLWTQRLVEALGNTLAAPVLRLGARSYSILDSILLLALFVVLIRLVSWLQAALRNRVLLHTGMSLGAQEAVAFLVHYGLLFVGSLVLLQLWGLDLSSLTIFAGVLGVGVGLGLQGIAKNFVSGLVITFERPIQVGDFVEIGDLQGTVRRINLRSTEVVTLDAISIIVPNSEFLESRVVNWSHGSSISRLKLPIGVAYGSDPEAVRAALVEAAQDHPDILKQPSPHVFFVGFGDSSLDFQLLVWIRQPKRQYEIVSDLNFRIEAILRQRGLTIPFPQRDLHLRNDDLRIDLPAEINQTLLALLQRLGPPP